MDSLGLTGQVSIACVATETQHPRLIFGPQTHTCIPTYIQTDIYSYKKGSESCYHTTLYGGGRHENISLLQLNIKKAM